MIHYSCDLCGRSIGENHFVAKIEVAPSFDPDALSESDLDVDHLEQIAEMIADTGTTGDFELDDAAPRQFQFDLCANCTQKYVKAPLGPVRPNARLNYSQN